MVYGRYAMSNEGMTLPKLSHITRERKTAGFPLKSVSVFSPKSLVSKTMGSMDWHVEELEECAGAFEPVTGGDVVDWKVDNYFLVGLGDELHRD